MRQVSDKTVLHEKQIDSFRLEVKCCSKYVFNKKNELTRNQQVVMNLDHKT